MNVIQTNYRIVSQEKTYEGSCPIPESVWKYSSDEYPQDHPDIPNIGICEDPVLSKIKEELQIKDRILMYDFYPSRKYDQQTYLGYEVLEEDE